MIQDNLQNSQSIRSYQISFSQKTAEIFSYSLPLIFLGLSSFASKIPSDDESSIEYKKFINGLISLSTSILSCGFGGYLGCQIRKQIDRNLLIDNSLENSNYHYSNKILFNIGFTTLNSIVSASITYGFSDSNKSQNAIEYGSAGGIAFGTLLNALAIINDRNHRKKRSIFLNIGQHQRNWARAEIALEINNDILDENQLTEDRGLTIISPNQQHLDPETTDHEFELYCLLKNQCDLYRGEILKLKNLTKEIILKQEKFEKKIYLEFNLEKINEELFKLIILKLKHEGSMDKFYNLDDLDQLIDKFKFEFLEKSKKINCTKFIQALKTSGHQEIFLEQLQKINQLSTFLESIQPESNLPKFLDDLNSLNQLSVFLDAFRKLGHPNKFISDDLIKNSSLEGYCEQKNKMDELDFIILDFIDEREKKLKLYDQKIKQNKKDLIARKNLISLRNSLQSYINLLIEAETKLHEYDLKFKIEDEKIEQNKSQNPSTSLLANKDLQKPIIISCECPSRWLSISSNIS